MTVLLCPIFLLKYLKLVCFLSDIRIDWNNLWDYLFIIMTSPSWLVAFWVLAGCFTLFYFPDLGFPCMFLLFYTLSCNYEPEFCPSYVLEIQKEFGVPLVGLVPFGAMLFLCVGNANFWVLSSCFWFTSYVLQITFSLYFFLLQLTQLWFNMSMCVLYEVIYIGSITLWYNMGWYFVK